MWRRIPCTNWVRIFWRVDIRDLITPFKFGDEKNGYIAYFEYVYFARRYHMWIIMICKTLLLLYVTWLAPENFTTVLCNWQWCKQDFFQDQDFLSQAKKTRFFQDWDFSQYQDQHNYLATVKIFKSVNSVFAGKYISQNETWMFAFFVFFLKHIVQ